MLIGARRRFVKLDGLGQSPMDLGSDRFAVAIPNIIDFISAFRSLIIMLEMVHHNIRKTRRVEPGTRAKSHHVTREARVPEA